ncbi:MAG: DUF485 domain-containing protein [Rhodospirillales bacterium]|nr:DUF485 domain-containing protein [Rhodospirillales bacterium]
MRSKFITPLSYDATLAQKDIATANTRGTKMAPHVAVNADFAEKVRRNPAFAELAARRGRFSWTIAIVMLAIYYGFILVVGFDKGLLGLSVGGAITLAFPVGLAVIVIAILLTGLYVLRANGEYDKLTHRIREGVQ